MHNTVSDLSAAGAAAITEVTGVEGVGRGRAGPDLLQSVADSLEAVINLAPPMMIAAKMKIDRMSAMVDSRRSTARCTPRGC